MLHLPWQNDGCADVYNYKQLTLLGRRQLQTCKVSKDLAGLYPQAIFYL